MANIIKVLEQQLFLRLLEERKQYRARFDIDHEYMKDTDKLMRVLLDERSRETATRIIETPFMNQETLVNYKTSLN